MGWALSELVYERQNVTPGSLAISDRTDQKLLDLNLRDIRLYERAKAHLDGKVSAYKGDFEKKLFIFRNLNEIYGAGHRHRTSELRRCALPRAEYRQVPQPRTAFAQRRGPCMQRNSVRPFLAAPKRTPDPA
jgi:hypothetical protein